jgi:hypothetical protein
MMRIIDTSFQIPKNGVTYHTKVHTLLDNFKHKLVDLSLILLKIGTSVRL